MGIAPWIMITLSFSELMSEALDASGVFPSIAGFGAGSTLMILLDALLPHVHF
jgi:zinc transporter ZupT